MLDWISQFGMINSFGFAGIYSERESSPAIQLSLGITGIALYHVSIWAKKKTTEAFALHEAELINEIPLSGPNAP